jgi:hypothetical protein
MGTSAAVLLLACDPLAQILIFFLVVGTGGGVPSCSPTGDVDSMVLYSNLKSIIELKASL